LKAIELRHATFVAFLGVFNQIDGHAMKRKISLVRTKANKFHKILIDLRATFVDQSNLN
jgi:hypothetical protein